MSESSVLPQTGGSAHVSGNAYVAFDHSSSSEFAGSYPEVVASTHGGGRKKRRTKKRKITMKRKAKKTGKALKLKRRQSLRVESAEPKSTNYRILY